MSLEHEFYEMQSALAATGQLTDEELAALERHAGDCPACAECMRDMAEISREVFVAQAMTMPGRVAPARMQERFLERAAQAGIGLGRSTPGWARADLPLAAVVAVFVLLVSIRPSAPAVEPAPTSAYAVQETKLDSTVQMPPAGVHRIRVRQRRVASHLAGDAPRDLPTEYSARTNLLPDGMRLAQLTPLTYTPARSFTRDGDVAAFFGNKDASKPEERTFHLDLKLASLSFLDFPRNNGSEPNTVSPAFGIPAFHLNNNRIW